MLLSVQDPGCSSFLIPSTYKDPEAFEQLMDKYETELIDETMKPFINSGHAFICFDSVNSLNTILKHFKSTPSQYIKIILHAIRNKCNSFYLWI